MPSGVLLDMSVYMPCPRPGCDDEVEFDVKSDSDDYRRWTYAEATSDGCADGHVLTDEEWEAIQEKADHQAAEYSLIYVPAGMS